MDNNNINNIDVSECFYFIDHTPPKGQGDWCGAIHKGACKVYSKDCKYNKDCYFKQLKRLQKENEKIRQNWRLDCLKCEYKNTKADVDKYKQALEEIREIAKHWLNNDWSCFHCRSNMDEKLKEIIKLTRF